MVGKVQKFNGSGLLQEFQGGSAYSRGFGFEAEEVQGAIRDKYLALGGPTSILGYPITDEATTQDGAGRLNAFERDSIYYHPSIGAFEVYGAISPLWKALGAEAFGYPLMDETTVPDEMGRFTHFRAFGNGVPVGDRSIYWHQDTGAHEVQGGIRDTWHATGWEAGYLGYPVSDEHDGPEGRQSDFQHGSIIATVNVIQERPAMVWVNGPDITFGLGIAIGGSARLIAYSDGTTRFMGHLHDSGAASYDTLVVFSMRTGDGKTAFAATHTGRTHGTDEPGSRNVDWDDRGTNDDIRKRWPAIKAQGAGGYHAEVTSDWSPTKIAEDVAAAIGLGVTIGGLIALVLCGGAAKSADPKYILPGANEQAIDATLLP